MTMTMAGQTHQYQEQHDLPRMLTRDNSELYINKLYTEKATYLLWIIFSWIVCTLNLVFVVISLRDAWNNNYSGVMHLFASLVMTATIFALMLIHEYIIRKKNNNAT